MAVSSLLRKQLTAFLTSVGRHNKVAFCLTDMTLKPVVCAEHFHRDALVSSAPPAGRLLKPAGAGGEAGLRLFAEKEAGYPETTALESVLDLAAEGIRLFLKNEEEIQKISEELLERYQELHVLYDVIEDVSAVFDEDEICRIILAKALHSLDVGFGIVALTEGSDLAIRIKELDPKSALSLSETEGLVFAKEVVTTGRHLVLENTVQDGPSVLGVPIDVNNKTIGAIVLAAKKNAGMFTSGDRISLAALAGYLGVAVNTARLVTEAREAERLRNEIDFARQIQQSLLPERVPEFAKLDVAARCFPSAKVGGDLFGFLKLDSLHWVFMVADVAGHGLGAAFIMASLRSILRSESKPGVSAANILKNSNILLNEDTRENDVFATVFVALYSEEDNGLNYSNAGHPPALHWRASSRGFSELGEGGVVLGLFENETYDERFTRLESGDILVVFTDGITETKSENGEMYGDHRLREAIRSHSTDSAEDLLKAVLESVAQFRNGAPQRDDMTILVFKSR